MSGDLTRLHFADRSFDIIISFRQLPHLRHRRLLAAERSPVARYAVIIQFPTTRSFHKTLSLLFLFKRVCEPHTSRPYGIFKEDNAASKFWKTWFHSYSSASSYFLLMVPHRLLHCTQ